MFCFVLLVTLLVSLGLFAMWAEFRCTSKQNEYTRYTYHKIDESKLIPPWTGKVIERLPSWVYAHSSEAYQY